jgi:hypothetical protein
MLFKKYIKVTEFPKKEWTMKITTTCLLFVSSVLRPLHCVVNIAGYALHELQHQI